MTKNQIMKLVDEYAGEAMADMEYPNKHKRDKARAAVVAALKGVSSVHTPDLMAAAKLALDAMSLVRYAVANGAIHVDVMAFNTAIEALKKAGVK